MIQKLHNHLVQSKLLAPKSKYVVGVSGGVDSVALLYMLQALQKYYGWSLVVAHYNHKQRADSALDAELVGQLAGSYNLPFYLGSNNSSTPQTEAELRKKRYEFLRNLKAELRAEAVVVAHHADDKIETAVFNTIRGASRGGITALRPIKRDIVRPLLPFTKAEIITFAALQNLAYREDSTNVELGFSRNFIRSELMPLGSLLYRDFKHDFLAKIAKLEQLDTRIESQLAYFLQETAVASKDSVDFNKPKLRSYSQPVITALLVHAIKKLKPGIGLGTSQIAEATKYVQKGKSGSHKHLGSGLHIEIGYDSVKITCMALAPKVLQIPTHVLSPSSPFVSPSHQIRLVDSAPSTVDGVSLRAKRAYVRQWQSGDRLYPMGMKGSKKLQDIFVDKKIPKALRHIWPVVVNEKNEIMWLPKVCIGADFVATKADKEVLHLVCEE